MELVVGMMARSPAQAEVEVVERKGLGHPDTLCDAVAEAASAALSRCYRERFGAVLHHNVDKVLLVGGASLPAFGGGRVTEPIELHLAGRAVREVGGRRLPVDELVRDAAIEWLRAHMRDLDPDRHVRVHTHLRPGSADLVGLFERGEGALANDTSIGVGFAPATPLERAVLEIDAHLRSEPVRRAHPHIGEDLKIMAVRRGRDVGFTVADAFVDRYVASLEDYGRRREAVRDLVCDRLAGAFGALEVSVNAADDLARGQVYLTVTGTSAEAGDDGEAGRGNRAGGLITPMRPMTMESVAGKNPVTHVGKVYNVVAGRIAAGVCDRIEPVREATCLLVSRIGAPVRDPQLAEVQLCTAPGVGPEEVQAAVEAVVRRELERAGDIDSTSVLADLTGARP